MNKLNTGYEEHTTKTKVSHLLDMDDLKLIGKREEELQKEMQVVRTFSDDIHTEFGLDKRAKIVLKRGKLVQSQNLILDFNKEIQQLKQGKTQKYLRIEDSEGIQHQQMQERLKKEYITTFRMILKSELNAKNKITAIGALAVLVLRHSFGIINLRLEEIRKIDRKTRKVLTMYKMHHPKADIDRLYVKRKGGGRGLLQTAMTHKGETINIAEYLNTKYTEQQFLNIVKSHESIQPNMNSTIKVAAKVVEELTQLNENSDTKRKAYNTKAKLGESLKKKLESKAMHGQHIRSMARQLNSEEDMFLRQSRGDLKGEIESEIIPAQDQALHTKYHATKILQTATDSQCRLCKQFDEIVEHIISCPILAKEK